MRKLLAIAGLIVLATPAFAADSVKVAVGHMCCGSCQAAATAGAKTVPWADTVAIDGTNVTVTAKADQKIELVSLMDALNKAGFPAMTIETTGPVTLTMNHMCCGGCVADLKDKLGKVRSDALDHDNVTIDLATKTIVLRPVAGKTLNVVPVLMQIQNAGWSANTCMLQPAAATAHR